MIGEPKRCEIHVVIEGDNVKMNQKWDYSILGIKTSGESSVETNVVKVIQNIHDISVLDESGIDNPVKQAELAGKLGISIPLMAALAGIYLRAKKEVKKGA